ncbi:10811_t:CDS:2 [Cetraspora pellucida]|uniref:10811_t:CDS:1 n=1 Tax=Cetraspora pellucida TaxID=1433469 RepID=A0ACA9MZ68_9GLOM|nr:10811_t:CDS:2 [Cetraspora pellucida]
MSSKANNKCYRDECLFRNRSICNLISEFFRNSDDNPPTKSTKNNCTRCDRKKIYGGFGEVFSAIWSDGPRTKWNAEKNYWERYSNVNVALKSLKNIKEEDITIDLFKELKSHLKSNDQILGRFNVLRTYGITFDPESKAYMMVMTLADYGDLSTYLQEHFSTLNYIKQFELLYDIATGS